MQNFLAAFSDKFDAFIITFYRVTGIPVVDFFFGTFVLALICVILGELTVSLALKFNKRYIDSMAQEMNEKERLSIQAYKAGDRRSYKALNKEATDAWGKHFFTMIAYAAGILWPLPFALSWMEGRFGDVDFPLVYPLSLLLGQPVGYTFSFIPLYILARILFKYMRPWLPYFKGVQKFLDTSDAKEAPQG
jgi:hypothetical protein